MPVFGFHAQDYPAHALYRLRRGPRSNAQSPPQQLQIPRVPRSVGTGYSLHLHEVDIPSRRVKRGVGRRADEESASVHWVRGRDGGGGGVGVESLASGVLLPGGVCEEVWEFGEAEGGK